MKCAHCGRDDPVPSVEPYYVGPAGEGQPGQRPVTIRWLHPGRCSREWWDRWREWKWPSQAATDEPPAP